MIRLNDDKEIVKTVREGLKNNGGYCPCKREKTEDTKCMCKEFREQISDPDFEGYCHCYLYYKSKDEIISGSEEDRIKKGIMFCPGAQELRQIKLKAHNLDYDYNKTYEDETEKRSAILSELIGSMGKNCFMQGPIYFHYGIHTHIGDRLFANFNFTVQDDAEVYIGNDCNFGPNCTIVTPMHPYLPDERNAMLDANGERKRMCYAKPVHIGNSCWFGANVVVCPGVTIGDNCVIGAGSVVTRDIPENSFAAGSPCKVIREITKETDSMENKPEILADCKIIKS